MMIINTKHSTFNSRQSFAAPTVRGSAARTQQLPPALGLKWRKTGTTAPAKGQELENAKLAVEKLWKQRGYDPKKPEAIKARLGYACDQYEASAYLVTGALHKPLISHEEAKYVGKRIHNITAHREVSP